MQWNFKHPKSMPNTFWQHMKIFRRSLKDQVWKYKIKYCKTHTKQS